MNVVTRAVSLFAVDTWTLCGQQLGHCEDERHPLPSSDLNSCTLDEAVATYFESRHYDDASVHDLIRRLAGLEVDSTDAMVQSDGALELAEPVPVPMPAPTIPLYCDGRFSHVLSNDSNGDVAVVVYFKDERSIREPHLELPRNLQAILEGHETYEDFLKYVLNGDKSADQGQLDIEDGTVLNKKGTKNKKRHDRVKTDDVKNVTDFVGLKQWIAKKTGQVRNFGVEVWICPQNHNRWLYSWTENRYLHPSRWLDVEESSPERTGRKLYFEVHIVDVNC